MLSAPQKKRIAASRRLSIVLALVSAAVTLSLTFSASTVAAQADEYNVAEIPLPERWQDKSFEYSGLSWLGSRLVILPQYPARSGYQIPVIQRTELSRFVTQGEAFEGPILTEEMTLDTRVLTKQLVGYEGLESVAFYGKHAFFTIETEIADRTAGYVVRAEVDGSEIRIEIETLRPLFTQTKIGNLAYEAISVNQHGVHVLYELNGGPNQRPRVLSFDHDLQWKRTHRLLRPIEYRVTDATSELDDGSFYVMNYHWPGDGWESNTCLLTKAFGRGPTHAKSNVVERIIHVRPDGERGYAGDHDAPRQLQLMPGEARNWEGLEYLEGVGFLLISDEHPRTMLGLVRLPDDASKGRLKRYDAKR